MQDNIKVNIKAITRLNFTPDQGTAILKANDTMAEPLHNPNMDESIQPGVSIITCTNRINSLENVLANYLRQHYELLELIIVLNNNSMNLNEWKEKTEQLNNVRVFQVDEKVSLGQCLNLGINQSRFDYIAKFDDDDYYAPMYLQNAISAFRQTDADVVGKYSIFVYFENSKTLAIISAENENCYSNWVTGATLVVKKEVFEKVRFRNISLSEDVKFSHDCLEKGFKIFAADRFDYVCIRRQPPETHTWKIDEENMLNTWGKPLIQTSDFRPFITLENPEQKK